METSVLETSFVEQSGYAKTAQFIYDLLTAKGLARDRYIEFTILKDEVDVSILDENKTEEARFFVMHTQVDIEIAQMCLYPKEIVEIQELAQDFANNTTFD